MTQKPYGKFTLEQLKTLVDLLSILPSLLKTLETDIKSAETAKSNQFVSSQFSWCHFYELSFTEHVASTVLVMGLHDDLHTFAQSDDPQQSAFDFVNNESEAFEWQGGFQGLFEKSDIVISLISLLKTIESIKINQKSLSTLVEEVRSGNDQALFNAVRVDRSMIACPTFAHRISIAEFQKDTDFFKKLQKALNGPSSKRLVYYDKLRYIMCALVEAGAQNLSGDDLVTIFVDHLKLFSDDPKQESKKSLLKHYAAAKKVKPLK